MKAKLVPIFFSEFSEAETERFNSRLEGLKKYYGDYADFLAPQIIGDPIPDNADAVVFPVLMFGAYRHDDELKKISLPFIMLTSKYATVEMWDWEIITYLRLLGCEVFSPYTEQLAAVVLRSLAVKRSLSEGAKFLIFQDDPENGLRPDIFKRFYWWEDDSKKKLQDAFGCRLIYRSWREVCNESLTLGDDEARKVCIGWNIPLENVSESDYLRAVKLYIVISRIVDEIGDISGIGANCMNEAHLCDTTPCLVWNMLFEQRGIVWACEGDTMSLISMYIMYNCTKAPLMMTNIYPFLSGMAALEHEKIDRFPDVEHPENCALVAHCGYLGFVPREFCTEWVFRPHVLTVTSDTAMALDCRMPTGAVTLAKLHPDFKHMTLINATLEGYAQYPGSHCRNGAVIRYGDGNGVMENLCSHHIVILGRDVRAEMMQVAKIFDFTLSEI